MVKKIGISAAFIVALLGLGYFSLTAVGKPISTDLSLIGQGKPVLVLVYENYSPTGADALDRLNQVKGDYASRLDFVIADLGVPEGRAFARRYQLTNGQAMFLKQDGEPLRATYIPEDEQELRGRLESKLASVE